MVVENDAVVVHHSFANGRLYHMEGGDDEGDGAGDDAGEEDEGIEDDEDELGALRFEPEAGPMLERLLHDEDAAEVGVGVSDLPLWPVEARLDAVRRLVARASSPSSTEDAVRERFRVFLMVHDYTFDDASL